MQKWITFLVPKALVLSLRELAWHVLVGGPLGQAKELERWNSIVSYKAWLLWVLEYRCKYMALTHLMHEFFVLRVTCLPTASKHSLGTLCWYRPGKADAAAFYYPINYIFTSDDRLFDQVLRVQRHLRPCKRWLYQRTILEPLPLSILPTPLCI